MSLERLKSTTDMISGCLSEQYDRNNPDEVTGKIQEFSALLGTSSESVALAEMVYSQKIMEITEGMANSPLSATDKKYILAGRAKQEAYYVTLTERQNRALTHVLDALRSVISFLKQDMFNTRDQTT